MKGVGFSYRNAGISQRDIHAAVPILSTAISQLNNLKGKGYDGYASSINLPADRAMFSKVKKLAKKYRKAAVIVVIGIGGSNLGAMAVYDAVKGKYANFHEPK